MWKGIGLGGTERCYTHNFLSLLSNGTTKMAVRGNMHNDTRVIDVADFKFEVKFEL